MLDTGKLNQSWIWAGPSMLEMRGLRGREGLCGRAEGLCGIAEGLCRRAEGLAVRSLGPLQRSG